MNHKIPATVAILTHNSATTLPRALESVKDFAEIVICDSNSTDDTLTIAHSFGARTMSQDAQFLFENGRIRNFSGVRNQMLAVASYDWFFFLDSDEYIGPELAKEIFEKTKGEPAAYWIPRKYVYHDTIIDCSVAYPSQQMRLFNRTVAERFIKEVHEKIELRAGVIPGWLIKPMFVPVPDTVGKLVAKWRGYLAIENTRRTPLSLRQWLQSVSRDAGIAVLYLLRLLRIVLFCRGTRLPITYELARVWYQCMLIKDAYGAIKK